MLDPHQHDFTNVELPARAWDLRIEPAPAQPNYIPCITPHKHILIATGIDKKLAASVAVSITGDGREREVEVIDGESNVLSLPLAPHAATSLVAQARLMGAKFVVSTEDLDTNIASDLIHAGGLVTWIQPNARPFLGSLQIEFDSVREQMEYDFGLAARENRVRREGLLAKHDDTPEIIYALNKALTLAFAEGVQAAVWGHVGSEEGPDVFKAEQLAADRMRIAEQAPITSYDALYAWNESLAATGMTVEQRVATDATLSKALRSAEFLRFWADLRFQYADAMLAAEAGPN